MTRYRIRDWIAPAALVLYLILLLALALGHGNAPPSRNVTLWDLQDSRRFLAWLFSLVVGGLVHTARFVPLGFLLPLALSSPPVRPLRKVLVALLAIILGTLLTFLVRGFEIGRLWQTPGSFDLMLPVAGCLFGVWLGMTWLRGWRARLWLLPKLAVLLIVLLGSAAAFVTLATEKKPAEFQGARVTSAEKRRLVRLVREKNSQKLKPGETGTLRLTEHDLDVLLAWGLSIGSGQRKAKVDLQPGGAVIRLSVAIPSFTNGRRYLNMRLGSSLEVRRGHLYLHIRELGFGRIAAPHWLLNLSSPILTTTLRHDRRLRPFLKSIQALRLEPAGMKVTYHRLELPKNFLPQLVSAPGGSEAVVEATRAQIQNLLATAGKLPRGDARFGAALRTAFSLARSRSQRSDPVLENRAAIFALGVVLGHPHLARFIGPVGDGGLISKAQRALGRVTLRGRHDWTQHFLVSASLALLSAQAVSDAAGLLKEELDAGKGGSGFSFADLLADRAGTTFALASTRSEAAARTMQERLATGFRLDDFFPQAADLPEGIPDAELQKRYGGVGGKAYQKIVAEIERRIAACAAYR